MFNINLDQNTEYKKLPFSENPFGKADSGNNAVIFHKNTSNYYQVVHIFPSNNRYITLEASNNNGSSWVSIFNYSDQSKLSHATFVLPKGYWLRNAQNASGAFTGYIEQSNY